MRLVITTSAAIVISLAANASELIVAKTIVGHWFSESTYKYGRILAIEHLNPDGSFSTEFRECFDAGGSKDHVESGHWTVSGGRLKQVTEAVAAGRVHLTAEYDTKSIDTYVWNMQTVGGDALQVFGPETFREVRVSADSKLPGCMMTS